MYLVILGWFCVFHHQHGMILRIPEPLLVNSGTEKTHKHYANGDANFSIELLPNISTTQMVWFFFYRNNNKETSEYHLNFGKFKDKEGKMTVERMVWDCVNLYKIYSNFFLILSTNQNEFKAEKSRNVNEIIFS